MKTSPIIRSVSQRMAESSRLHAPVLAAIVALVISLTCTGGVQATAIGIDLGPSRVIAGNNPETPRIGFDGLNGTPVVGAVSADFLFTHNQFVRLFTVTKPSFDALINLQTDGSGFLGFLNGTGYLIDAQGKAIPGFGVTGSSSGDDASMAIGLFPLLADKNGTPNDQLQRPIDFYGVHYDFTFPSHPSIEVTGGWFKLADNGMSTAFGIGPDIPADIVRDGDSMLSLVVSIVLTVLVGLRIRTA